MCLLSFVYNQNTVTSVNEILSLKKFAVWGVGGIVKGLNHSSVSTEQGIYRVFFNEESKVSGPKSI